MSGRWVWIYVPDHKSKMDRAIFGSEPFVLGKAPKGVGREVRLATDAETGLFSRLALPAAKQP